MVKGKPFQKGVSGNPGGRKRNDDVIAFRETTYKDFIDTLQKYGAFNPLQMVAELQKPDITMFQKIFGRIVLGAANGDKDARNVLLERLWGKVKQKIEHNDNDAPERERLRRMSMQELTELVKENLSK